jgi:hypothetical protein
VVLGALTALLSALLLGGWASKESTEAHASDVRALRSERRSITDSLRFEQSRSLDSIHYELHQIRDAVCEGKSRRGPCK